MESNNYRPCCISFVVTVLTNQGKCNILWGYGGLAQTGELSVGTKLFFDNWDETLPSSRHYRLLGTQNTIIIIDPKQICTKIPPIFVNFQWKCIQV